MRRSTWTIQDAKNRFGAVVEAARRQPQTMTKHCKPAVVVVAAKEYARLRRLERITAKSFTDHVLAMPADDGDFGRGDRLVAHLRGRGDMAMSTDAILALTRGR